jgi:ribosomal biogenesis protein LAS1
MEAYEFTPWRDRKELLNIRQRLYWIPWTKEPDRRKQACSIVFAWKLLGHLPHAVESTALLTEAILADKPDVVSSYAIQLSYVSAFCR